MTNYIFATGLFLASLCVATQGAARAADGDSFSRAFGGMEVVALLDAGNRGPDRPELLIGLSQPDRDKYLKPGSMANSINVFVVKMGGKTLMFDTGLGVGKGQLQGSLAKAGLSPSDIDDVVITHFHGDHVGGLVDNGKPAFPRATLHLGRLEVDKWDPKGLGFIPVYGDKVKKFELGDEVAPGVKSVAAVGHTPGHTAFLLENGGGRLLIVGDAVHFTNIQLPLPDVAVTYDTDPVQAVAARKKLFDFAVAENLPIAGMHIAFPGMGTLAKEGTGYSMAPVGR